MCRTLGVGGGPSPPVSEEAFYFPTDSDGAWLLVLDGEMVQVEAPHDRRTRRTVIAQDRWGHILWITIPAGGMTLWDMANYLPRTDLGVQMAVNLDGGSSSLLALRPRNGHAGRRSESRAGCAGADDALKRRHKSGVFSMSA